MDFKKICLLLTGLLFSVVAHANTISLNTISADSTNSTLNANFTTLSNWANGNVEGSTDGTSVTNIKADSVYEINMADDANPRVRDSELLGITVDTTAVQGSFVYSGLIPATDSDLTSDISAGIAYVNGYRVSKGATSKTYTASKDTYVDLGQNGTYTFTEVANGASAPTVAANSARIAKVVTDGTTITTSTDLANRRLPGLVVPANFRKGFMISRDSTTQISLTPGTVEINNTMVTVSTATTLLITTAGNWAGGSSLQAVSTHAYVGIDASGNIKLHTTAPTHANYAVSSTVGTKRYATWSGTVYRIIDWFYMNATGSGEVDTWAVGNFPADGIPTTVVRTDTTGDTVNDTAYGSDLTGTTLNVYSTGGDWLVHHNSTSTAANWMNNSYSTIMSADGSGSQLYERFNNGTGTVPGSLDNTNKIYLAQGTHTILFRGAVTGSDDMINRKTTIAEETN